MKETPGTFDLTEDNEDHFMLTAPSGVVLKIAKSGLSKDTAKKIHGFASGGKVKKEYSVLPEGEDITRKVAMGMNPSFTPDMTQQPNYIADATQQVLQPPTPAFQNIPLDPGAPLPAPARPQVPTPGGSRNTPGEIRANISQYEAGAQAEAKAVGELSLQQAEAQQAQQQKQEELLQNYLKNYKAIETNIDALTKKMLEKDADPNRAWHNRSSGEKVSAIIGMILGGIGSGLTGQENLAVKMLNAEIDRDIKAQEMDEGKKRTVLESFHQQYGHNTNATNMLRLHYQAMNVAKLEQLAAQSNNPILQARVQQTVAQYKNQMLLQMQETAAQQTIWQDKQVKEMEAKYIPGTGIAEIPVTNENREELTDRMDLNQKLQSMENFIAENSGSMSSAAVNKGKSMARAIADTYKRANKQRALKEEEIGFLEGMLGKSPTAFFAKIKALPFYKQMRTDNYESMRIVLKNLGISDAALPPLGVTIKGTPKYRDKGLSSAQ